MQLRELTGYLESIAPLALQESYDNAGLLVGDPSTTIEAVLVCLDVTEAVVDEAQRRGCNVIVAHHPIIFRGLKSLTGSNYVERVVIKAIRAEVAIYAIHTNLDHVFHQGVNARFASRLGLENTRILDPRPGLSHAAPSSAAPATATGEGRVEVGSGMIGDLPAPMPESAFIDFVKERMQTDCVRHTAFRSRPVQRVALCGGAGSFLIGKARSAGADAYVTADVKYHEFFDADGEILLADIGHYESEQFTIHALQECISNKFSNFAAFTTEVRTNPIHYRV